MYSMYIRNLLDFQLLIWYFIDMKVKQYNHIPPHMRPPKIPKLQKQQIKGMRGYIVNALTPLLLSIF